jgi:two-component system response regulator AtoC
MYGILIIGGDPQESEAVEERLRQRCQYATRLARSAKDGLAMHLEGGADLVLVVLPLPDGLGRDLLVRLRAQDPRGIVVVCGRDDQIQGAPDALEAGAFDYLSSPSDDPDRLLTVMGVSLGARRSDAQLRFLRRKDANGSSWQTIVGDCPQMRKISATVRQICHRTLRGSGPTILICGETGTGKGLIAKAIHYNSSRRSGAFVDINCAAVPPSLIEVELFGHARGAYTDARTDRPGLLETADGGTLFLDEIGALQLELQAKLLNALEEKITRRIGDNKGKPISIQTIAATHEDLEAMVQGNRFRLDLYHRLNVVRIDLPPLRERGEDRVLLVQTFVAAMCQRYGLPVKRLSAEARRAIEAYPWPGNVRELQNQIERIVMLEESEVIEPWHFTLPGSDVMQIQHGPQGLAISLPERSCPLEQLEREVIRQALDKHQGNVSHTARYLGITRHTLIYRIKKHALEAKV